MSGPIVLTDDPVKTTCPYCGVGCGVIAQKVGEGKVSIKGDKHHPANLGRLCSKGSALGETIDHDHRLLNPSINGKQVSWDKALFAVADGFSKTIEQHGSDAVAFYVSGQLLTEDYYVANKLMKGFIGSANIDTNSRLCMSSAVVGHKRAFGSDTVGLCYEDLEEAEAIIVIGSNIAWCHPVSDATEARAVVSEASQTRAQAIKAAEWHEHGLARRLRLHADVLDARLVDPLWRAFASRALQITA